MIPRGSWVILDLKSSKASRSVSFLRIDKAEDVKHKRRRTKALGQKTGEGTKKPIENNS
jgi:hypothetical protein